MSTIPREVVWLAAYLTSLYKMLPYPDEIDAMDSRIPHDAAFFANRAVESFDGFVAEKL